MNEARCRKTNLAQYKGRFGVRNAWHFAPPEQNLVLGSSGQQSEQRQEWLGW